MLKKKAQTYNDGICTIYRVGNVAAAGNMPQEGLVFRAGPLRYEARIVGMNRFYAAMQAQTIISRMIRTQRTGDVEELDVAILEDGRQYRIKQLQYPQDVVPLSTDMSLERMEPAYPDARIESLQIGNLSLSPIFNLAAFNYSARTSSEEDSISATAIDPAAQVEIIVNGNAIETGSNAVWLDGENTVQITVTVPGMTRTYSVTVTHVAPADN